MGAFLKIVAFLALALCGCVSIEVGPDDGSERSARTHIGITRITTPEATDHVAAVDISTLGIGWDDGPFVGWRESRLVFADPEECRLIVIVRSPAQAENAVEILRALEGQNPCIANFTETQQLALPE